MEINNNLINTQINTKTLWRKNKYESNSKPKLIISFPISNWVFLLEDIVNMFFKTMQTYYI